MSAHAKLYTGIVVSSLVALVVAGCATAPTSRVGSGDVVADRQRLMKLNGASLTDLQAKAKAGNVEGIAVNAETIAVNALHIATLFPPGSITEKSKAKPEIWQKWDEFEGAAKNLRAQAEKLRDAARAKNTEATQAMVRDFAKQTCGSCHTPYNGGKSFGPIFRSLLPARS